MPALRPTIRVWHQGEWPGRVAAIALASALLVLSGCSAVGSRAAAGVSGQLSAAILEQGDPELVRDGLPAYLLLVDALSRNSPDDPAILGAATQLYALYGTGFGVEPERARQLTSSARDFGGRALCAALPRACTLDESDFDSFAAIIDAVPPRNDAALFSYAVGQLAYVRAHAGDWSAIAGLPRIEHVLHHLVGTRDTNLAVSANTYLGILDTLRPEALGGKPAEGRACFEKAIALSSGTDLTAKVEYARGYARLVYDRGLHDRLLKEVIEAPARQTGRTLFNTIAQREAKQLLASADDYF